jgi:hypothetical protein
MALARLVLAGLSMPIWHWRDADREVTQVLSRYGLADQEFHTAWILKKYFEQSKIPHFDSMNWMARRAAVNSARAAKLLELQRRQQSKTYRQQKKDYSHTAAYVHLTHVERVSLVREVADIVSRWGFSRLFAECVDKIHFDPLRSARSVEEQAFEQVVSRFQRYLVNVEEPGVRNYGILVHDNNQSVAKKHTDLMRHFHEQGTLWAAVDRIIETPMFVDSKLTRMVQIADLCAYSLRRFVENGEADLFNRIFRRADRIGATAVGVRHFAPMTCVCVICAAHRI